MWPDHRTRISSHPDGRDGPHPDDRPAAATRTASANRTNRRNLSSAAFLVMWRDAPHHEELAPDAGLSPYGGISVRHDREEIGFGHLDRPFRTVRIGSQQGSVQIEAIPS